LWSPAYPYSEAPDGLFITKNGIPKHVIAYFRIKTWEPTPKEVEDFTKDGTLPSWSPFKENSKFAEENALKKLIEDLADAIERYPQGYKEDQEILKDVSQLSQNKKIAIKMRYEEKMLLNKQRNSILYPKDKMNFDKNIL